MPDLLALGEALIELTRDTQNPLLWRQGFGGDTSNALVAAARQGARTGYLSAVGGDTFGTALRDLWAREGVDATHVVTRDTDPTGVYFVVPHASGRAFSYARRGSAASHYGPDDLPHEAIAAARVLHVSGISQAISDSMRSSVLAAARLARAEGTRLSYDINLRPNLWSLETARAALAEILPMIDILFPSDDEAEALLGLSAPEAMLDHFAEAGADIIVLKRGAQGAMMRIGGETVTIPPQPADPVDSTGAGDSFAGAFLAYLIETDDPERAAHLAARVAAGTVSGLGAIAPIPRRVDLSL